MIRDKSTRAILIGPGAKLAVSDELLDLDNDATVATLVDRIAGELREHEIQSFHAAEAREWVPSSARLRIVARREQASARVGMTTRSPKSMRGNGGRLAPKPSAA